MRVPNFAERSIDPRSPVRRRRTAQHIRRKNTPKNGHIACYEKPYSVKTESEDEMANHDGKSTWSASGEPLLNVPQSERSDDAGEHSEVLSDDLERPPTQRAEDTELHATHRSGPPSSTSPEAPLVFPEKDARARNDDEPADPTTPR
jgi:hypothetical protein